MAGAAKSGPKRVVRCWAKERVPDLVEDLKVQIGHRHHVIRTHCSVGIGWRAAAKVAVAVKTDDGSRYAYLTEHSLHNWIANDRTDRPERNGALLLVLAQCTPLWKQRFHAAQGGRDIELHHRHHAAILGTDERLRILCRRSGLRRGFAKCKKHKCNCRKAKQNGN
ncbi:MAG: hypothetical protein DME64_08535 [Verrucomicrobia bacterium]|nr:MAG: hypothetical protein DME64_08535 [Verrucomicrobiota bacterium]